MKHLIVTADDFGLAAEVNDAVEIAHQRGILTAASLMVAGPAAEDAVARAKRLPSLKVGLHLVLTDGRAILPPSRLTKLVDATGAFHGSMVSAAMRMAFDPAARDQLAAEIEAQFAAYSRTGLPLDHVDCHKHFHLHPTIGRLVIEIGSRYGMKALRVPAEPRDIVETGGTAGFDPALPITRLCAERLGHRVDRQNIYSADRVFGLKWSGAMNESRVLGLLANLPDGVSEMYFHPATANAFSGAAPGYRYADEFAALVSPAVKQVISDCVIDLSSYSEAAAHSHS